MLAELKSWSFPKKLWVLIVGSISILIDFWDKKCKRLNWKCFLQFQRTPQNNGEIVVTSFEGRRGEYKPAEIPWPSIKYGICWNLVERCVATFWLLSVINEIIRFLLPVEVSISIFSILYSFIAILLHFHSVF